MKNKLFFFISIIIFISGYAFSEVVADVTSDLIHSDGYFMYLTNNIDKNVSVTISNVDTTLSGKLLNVHDDGIYIQTAFNNYIFIFRKSIAYIRITP